MRRALTLYLFGILTIFTDTIQANSSTVAARIASAAVVKTIGPGSSGSGVLIEVPRPNGMGTIPVVVTAAHVIKGTGKAETVQFQMHDDSFIEAKGADIVILEDVDLAFIKLDASALRPNKYIYAKVGNSNLMNSGDTVVVSGYPLALQQNVSNRVRISDGIIQTFSRTDAKKALTGYSATTFPGMSGGGVFNDKGELIYIHLKGEKDISRSSNTSITSTAKSGTNYGISVLHAIERLRELETGAKEPTSPLERFKRGLYFVQSNMPNSAYKIFAQLSEEYPDSLIAEWSAKCMKAQVEHPHGQPTYWPEGELSQEEFVRKHGVKPVYRWPYFSDSAIWGEKERRVLLSYDPLYKLARPLDEWSYSNRGALVEVNSEGHCERIPGLGSYRDRNNKEVIYWEMIPNPSKFIRNRNFATDPKTFRQVLIPQEQE